MTVALKLISFTRTALIFTCQLYRFRAAGQQFAIFVAFIDKSGGLFYYKPKLTWG
jgi:hypothetical protein